MYHPETDPDSGTKGFSWRVVCIVLALGLIVISVGVGLKSFL